MVMPNFMFSAGQSYSFPTVSYAADNVAFGASDYCAASVNSSRIRFTRPTVDGQGFEYANPGARVRFRTDSESINFRLDYTNLVTRPDTYNGVGLILVDGVQVDTFNRAQGAAGQISKMVVFGSTATRTIELVMPYCASVDFLGVDLVAGATLSASPARTATRYVAIGDSITHGFVVSDVGKEWAYKLAEAKGWQLINHGYGGRQCAPADGTTLAALNPDVATYLIGYNNFYPQTPLATFKASFKSFINNFRAVNTTTKLYCITPTWTPNSFGALTIEMYRQQIMDALTELGNPLNILVEGEALATSSVSRFPDNVHPNDIGAAEIAASLQSIVVV